MSSDSDTDDDVQRKKFLEAADFSLLNNSMFKQKDETIKRDDKDKIVKTDKDLECDLPKSQRYLIEYNENSAFDFNMPESMQKHFAKKFSKILKEHYEFYEATESNLPKVKSKNRVKLFKGDNSYVNPYEDFEYETKGPTKKPVIKRRNIEDGTSHNGDEDTLKLVAVDANFILSCKEVNSWAKKKERKDKVFHYKLASTGVAHAEEETNEFTEIRRKNKWKESKIKGFKKS